MKKCKKQCHFNVYSRQLFLGIFFFLGGNFSHAQDDQKIQIPLECEKGASAFTKSIKDYYEQVGKVFENETQYPAEAMKDMVFGEKQNEQELTLLAAPLLLDEHPELPFSMSLRACWRNIDEFVKHLDKGDWKNGDREFQEWTQCSANLYMKENTDHKLPSLVAEIKACYDKVKKKIQQEKKLLPKVAEAVEDGV